MEAASERSELRSMCGRASVENNSRFDFALTTTFGWLVTSTSRLAIEPGALRA
jgi:hypothetical protein